MTIKKRFIALIIFLIFFTALVFGSLYYQVNESVTVKASLFDVSEHLANGNNWVKWNPLLVNATNKKRLSNSTIAQVITMPDGSFLKLTITNPASFTTEQHITGSTISQAITIHPSVNYGFTEVLWIKKQRGFKWVLDNVFGENTLSAQLKGLKNYVETPSHLYGFPIKLSGVTDALICTKKQYITAENKQPYVKAMVVDMFKYLESNHIDFTKTYYYVSYSKQASGKTELAVGIPVKAASSPNEGYEFLKLPANGQILTGTYAGPYAGLGNLSKLFIHHIFIHSAV